MCIHKSISTYAFKKLIAQEEGSTKMFQTFFHTKTKKKCRSCHRRVGRMKPKPCFVTLSKTKQKKQKTKKMTGFVANNPHSPKKNKKG